MKQHFKFVIILSLIAITLALVGGEPYRHSDSILPQVINALQEQGNPINLKYPGGIVIYPNVIAYGIFYMVLRFFNIVDNTTEFKYLIRTDTNLFSSFLFDIDSSLPGHLVTVLFSLLGVVFTYITTYRLTRKISIAFISGLFLSTSLLWVVNSHYTTVDIPMTSMAIATVCFTVIFLEKKQPLRLYQLIIIGSLWGLTASAKWTGAVIGVSIIMPMIFCYPNQYFKLFKDWILVSLFALISFLLTNPYILIEFNKFITQFISLLGDGSTGWYGHTVSNGYIFYLNSLYLGYSLPLLILAVIGLWSILKSPEIPITSKITVIIFTILFYLLMGRSKMGFHRYILPVFPFLAIYSACGCDYLYDLLKTKTKLMSSTILSILVVIVTFSIWINTSYSIKHNLVMRNQDTRQELTKILNDANIENKQLTIYAGGQLGYSNLSPINSSNLNVVELITAPSGRNANHIVARMNQMIDRQASMNLMFFDSFSHDPLIYEHQEEVQLNKFDPSQVLAVVQISPFIVSKEQTTYSIESSYSPFVPDLKWRKKPGPFIEIYIQKDGLTEEIIQSCQKNKINCKLISVGESFYFKNLL